MIDANLPSGHVVAPEPIPPPEPGTPPGAPIRLRLDLDAGVAADLRHTPAIADHLLKRPLIRKIDTVFWDTPGHLIGKAGFGLGLETMGRRRSQVMTRLGNGAVSIGTAARTELTLPPGADRPDPVRLAFLPGAEPDLAGRVEAQHLVPLFAVTIRRTQWLLQWKNAGLTLWLDEGVITAASGEEPVIQLSIASTGGPPVAVYDFARLLARSLPLRLSDLDTASRGYRRLFGDDWNPEALNPGLDAGMPVRDGILAIGQRAAAGFRTETALLAQSRTPGQIHQTRVAIRKLRSILSVFAGLLPQAASRSLARDLGKLASALGDVREWDVLLAETIDPLGRALSQLGGGDPPLKRLELTAKVLRDQAATEIGKRFGSGIVIDLSLRLSAFFDAGLWDETTPEMALWQDRSLGPFAEEILRKRHRKLKSLGEKLSQPSPAELHDLRIAAKKLRYVAEFFAPLFPGKTRRRYLSALRELQDTLGILNDAAVTQRLIARLTGTAGDDNQRAAGVIAGWTASESIQVERRFAKVWPGFMELKRFW